MYYPNAPLVSVVMPTYNGSRFIQASLISALEQKYPNMEFIIVNDGSIDTTQNIITSLQAENERIILVNNPTNQGIAKSYNNGIKTAKGEYIAILDHDDMWIDQYKIEKQVDFLEQHSDIGFLGTNTIVKAQRGNEYVFYKSEHPKTDKIIKENLLSTCPFTHSSVVYRNMYNQIGGYPEDILYAGDYGYRLNAGRYTKFANISDYTTLYNSHPDNTSHIHRLVMSMESLGLSWEYRNMYPNALRCLSKKTYQNLYSGLSMYMENHCPLFKDELRKVLGKPTRYPLESGQEINDILFSLQNS